MKIMALAATRSTTTTASNHLKYNQRRRWQLHRSTPSSPPLLLVITTAAFMCLCVLALMPSIILADSSSIGNSAEGELSPVKYSEFVLVGTTPPNTSNTSSDGAGFHFNAHRSMKPLYDIANKIILIIAGDNPLPEGYLVSRNNSIHLGPKVERNEWGALIKQHWIILLLVVLVCIVVCTMPIIGLCFCICRCFGACGGRSEPFDRKHDTARRVVYGFLLIVLATGIILGVIAAFVTNSYFESGLNEGTGVISKGNTEVQSFLTTTSQHMNHILVINFNELSDKFNRIITNMSKFIINELETKSLAKSQIVLDEYLNNFANIEEILRFIVDDVKYLRVNASQLDDGLRGVKRELLDKMIGYCKTKACKDFVDIHKIGTLNDNGIHYDPLPNIESTVTELKQFLDDDLANLGKAGVIELQRVRDKVEESVKQYTPELRRAIAAVGLALKNVSEGIQQEITKISTLINGKSDQCVAVTDDFLVQYSPYRFWIGVAVCTLLLLILLSLVIALLCGICGKRPDGYGDTCCNKGAGARFLMMAATLIFVFISAIALVALVHFLLGMFAYRAICVPLKNPQSDEVFAQLNNAFDLNELLYPSAAKRGGVQLPAVSGTLPPLRISQVIAACQENKTIYEVLFIQNHNDIHKIEDYVTNLKFNEKLEKVTIGAVNVRILSDPVKAKIKTFSESTLKDFDKDKFADELVGNITKFNLTRLADLTREFANECETQEWKCPKSQAKIVARTMRNQALHLNTYQKEVVEPMEQLSTYLTQNSTYVNKMLKYKDNNFAKTLDTLVKEVDSAEKFINENGDKFVKDTARNLTEYFTREILRYVLLVIDSVEKKVGLCYPLASVFDESVNTTCDTIVDPMNGYWAAVMWCVLLFLPTLLVAIKLANLYQKSDPYPGPLVESEYLYDAYSERDHIPMANGPKNKRRKNKDRRRREYYEEAVVGSSSHGGVPQAAVAAGGVRDTRYNDMAPKHWDGGPPRYQNPPMAPPASEYERPPPYYYPGATEQD